MMTKVRSTLKSPTPHPESAGYFSLLLRALVTVALALHLGGAIVGCASNTSEDEAAGGEESFAEESSGDFADEESESEDVAAADEEGPEGEDAGEEQASSGEEDLEDEVA